MVVLWVVTVGLWCRPALCAGGDWTVAIGVDACGGFAREEAEKVAAIRAAGGPGVCRLLGQDRGRGGADKLRGVRELVAEGARRAAGGPLVVGLCGHGSGALGGVGGLLSGPDDPGVSIAQLSGAISRGLAAAGRDRIDLVVLETCRSSAVEIAHELAPLARHCALVAGDLSRPGLAWPSLFREPAPGDGAALSSSQLVERLVGGSVRSSDRRAGVLLVDLSVMEEVAAAFSAVVDAAEARPAQAFWALGDLWGRQSRGEGTGVSVTGLAQRLAGVAGAEALGEAAERLREQVGRAQVGGWRRGGEAGWTPALTVYVPAPVGGELSAYEEACGLAVSSGYVRLLRAYEEYSLKSLPVGSLRPWDVIRTGGLIGLRCDGKRCGEAREPLRTG